MENVTSYLNTFGVTVADRIRNQFLPLFDPASEPLSEEVLAINDCIQQRAGYSLYDAQLAVAEAVNASWNGTAPLSLLRNVEAGRLIYGLELILLTGWRRTLCWMKRFRCAVCV